MLKKTISVELLFRMKFLGGCTLAVYALTVTAAAAMHGTRASATHHLFDVPVPAALAPQLEQQPTWAWLAAEAGAEAMEHATQPLHEMNEVELMVPVSVFVF